jgi:hypothetical protein
MANIKKFIDLLNEYPTKQFPLAARFIVNEMAFQSRQIAARNVEQRFIIRSKFVTSRIQFERAPFTRDPAQIKSKMGALESIDFMADQEVGFTNKAKSGSKLPIPTRAARVSQSVEKKKRTVYRKDRLGQLRRINQFKGKNKRQKIIAMLQEMARKNDKRAALIPFTNKPGIYVIRNRRKGKGKNKFNFKLHKLYDLSKRQQRVKANPWMAPTMEEISQKEGQIVEQAWRKFLSVIR